MEINLVCIMEIWDSIQMTGRSLHNIQTFFIKNNYTEGLMFKSLGRVVKHIP